MTQRKFVFMKFEDSLFLHFSEFFGEGAPVEVQVVGEALAVEGDRKGVGAGFGRLRGEVDQHALADRLWCRFYRNHLLERIAQRHTDAVRLMSWLFTSGFSSEQLWDRIEEYFLGLPIQGFDAPSVESR